VVLLNIGVGEDFHNFYDFSLKIASYLSRRGVRFHGEIEKRTLIMKRLLLILSLLPALFGAESDPAIREYYNEKAQIRMRNFEMPEDVTIKLWADESQTQNPSAITFDSQGRLYVAEINRWRFGVDDIRERRMMLVEDLEIQSNADRMKMFENHYGEFPPEHYTNKADQISVLEDTDGDGRADESKIFAGGFNDPLDGPGIGLIERDGKIYYTNIPHLWMLEDTDGDGVSDKRTSLQNGFGIRMSFSGHDMHGLTWGPDGKLYWSLGDRGYSLVTKEGKRFHGPNKGAVFRCDPDGANVELFYDSLRNPQELTWDDYGNLFTADNDADGVDLERVNYLVEGGESGWHAGHQSIMSFTKDLDLRSSKYTGDSKLPLGWITEYMWKVRHEDQPAFILPGVGQIIGGPSGFVFNPSNAMGEKYDDKFFVIIYKGSLTHSYISMFNLEDDGATFNLVNDEVFFRGSNCVDIDFGPDGKLYMSDYNYGGWLNQDVGNIYSMEVPGEIEKEEVVDNEAILLSDLSKLSIVELSKLLGQDHQQVRLKSQFELAKRGAAGVGAFTRAAENGRNSTFTRIHGVWGLGQMAGDEGISILDPLFDLLSDENDQVRIQTARVLGDRKVEASADLIVKSLRDAHPRVAMYAGIGLGRIGYAPAVPELLALLERNADEDLWLRHGAIMGLLGVDKSHWASAINDDSKYVRMGALLVLRKLQDPEIATFLRDSEQSLAYEAIRAINDLPMASVQSELASLIDDYLPGSSESMPESDVDALMHHRIINANYYLAKAGNARSLLRYASNKDVPERLRREALAALEGWNDQNPIDPTTGLPRENPAMRDSIDQVVQSEIAAILDSADSDVLIQTTRVAELFGYDVDRNILIAQLKNVENAVEVRSSALETLRKRNDEDLETLASSLLNNRNAVLRSAALEALLTANAKTGVTETIKATRSGPLKTKQRAYALLGAQSDSVSNKFLAKQLKAVVDGGGAPAVMLDVIEASRLRSESSIVELVTAYDQSILTAVPLVKYAASLKGGDAKIGEDVFKNHGAAQCVRCHKVGGDGADVGPDLTTIGRDRSREYLLEAIVDPGAAIAPGFGLMVLTRKDGEVVTGLLMEENDQLVSLKMADGKIQDIKKSEIASQQPPISGMPPMGYLLNQGEVRDLVAYLSTLKRAPKEDETEHE
jgi:quinoprotein glucose dehydrogenase